MRARHVLDELRVLERGGADHDAFDPRFEPALDIGGRADPAAQLDLARESGDDTLDRLAVLRRTREGAIEIDHMQMAGAGFGEQPGLRRRIVAVNGGAIHIALGKAHDFAVLQVDGGKDDHERSSG